MHGGHLRGHPTKRLATRSALESFAPHFTCRRRKIKCGNKPASRPQQAQTITVGGAPSGEQRKHKMQQKNRRQVGKVLSWTACGGIQICMCRPANGR